MYLFASVLSGILAGVIAGAFSRDVDMGVFANALVGAAGGGAIVYGLAQAIPEVFLADVHASEMFWVTLMLGAVGGFVLTGAVGLAAGKLTR